MDLQGWSEEGIDATRLRRLSVGYVLGAMGIAGAFAFFAATAKGQDLAEEDTVDVAFAELPEEEEPEPEEPEEPAEPPPPEPTAAPPKPMAAPRPGPKLAPLETPDEIPDDAPKETDPGASSGDDDPYRNGVGDGSGVGTGNQAPAPAPAPKPKPKPKPKKKKKKKPIRVTEDVTPPSPVSQSMPAYPSSAKSAGVEGTVIVAYVVTESGAVSGVRAVRGPAQLRGVCEAAVRKWKFKPAMLDGRPVSVRRVARFPFRIKTKR